MSEVLVSRLLARLDEIEKIAKAAPFDPYMIHVDNPEDGPHIRWHDPDSVLRLCRAHRDLIDQYREMQADGDMHARSWAAQMLSTVARGLGVEETGQ